MKNLIQFVDCKRDMMIIKKLLLKKGKLIMMNLILLGKVIPI